MALNGAYGTLPSLRRQRDEAARKSQKAADRRRREAARGKHGASNPLYGREPTPEELARLRRQAAGDAAPEAQGIPPSGEELARLRKQAADAALKARTETAQAELDANRGQGKKMTPAMRADVRAQAEDQQLQKWEKANVRRVAAGKEPLPKPLGYDEKIAARQTHRKTVHEEMVLRARRRWGRDTSPETMAGILGKPLPPTPGEPVTLATTFADTPQDDLVPGQTYLDPSGGIARWDGMHGWAPMRWNQQTQKIEYDAANLADWEHNPTTLRRLQEAIKDSPYAGEVEHIEKQREVWADQNPDAADEVQAEAMAAYDKARNDIYNRFAGSYTPAVEEQPQTSSDIAEQFGLPEGLPWILDKDGIPTLPKNWEEKPKPPETFDEWETSEEAEEPRKRAHVAADSAMKLAVTKEEDRRANAEAEKEKDKQRIPEAVAPDWDAYWAAYDEFMQREYKRWKPSGQQDLTDDDIAEIRALSPGETAGMTNDQIREAYRNSGG